MKNVCRLVLVSSVLSLVAACGSKTSQASLSQRSGAEVAQSESPVMLFSIDRRPGDGKLEEVAVIKDGADSFAVTLRVAYVDRVNGQVVDKTTVLVDGATCSFGELLVSCVNDALPVDGPLTEVHIVTKSNNTTDVVLRKVIADRRNGGMSESSQMIAKGLERKL